MSWENMVNKLSMHNKVVYIDKIGCQSYFFFDSTAKFTQAIIYTLKMVRKFIQERHMQSTLIP